MIQITPTLALDDSEIDIAFVQAAGPGGQNVNKVATAAQLRFDVAHSPSLPDDVRARLMQLAGKRLSAEGILIINARRFRTQERNRQDARDRLIDLVRQAATPPPVRRPTRPSRAARQNRIEAKRRRSETKRLRQEDHR